MAQSSQKGVGVSLVRISRLLENFPISSRMGRARRLAGSRRVRIALNTVFVSGALAAAALTMLHFAHSGWPLANADPLLVVAAGILFLFAYAFKAWGWQRLFAEGERPQALTLAAAGGAASVGGVALPGRFDEAIGVAGVASDLGLVGPARRGRLRSAECTRRRRVVHAGAGVPLCLRRVGGAADCARRGRDSGRCRRSDPDRRWHPQRPGARLRR